MRQEIERAIRTTLVVLNKQSINLAVDKIMEVVAKPCRLIIKEEELFGTYVDVPQTSCCLVGPITHEKNCPNCGREIFKVTICDFENMEFEKDDPFIITGAVIILVICVFFILGFAVVEILSI